MYDITSMWNLKKKHTKKPQASECNKKKKRKKKQTHRYRGQISGYPWGEGKGEEQYRGKLLRRTKYCI